MTRGPWNHSSSRTVLRACILSSGAPSTFAQDLFHANFFGLAGLPGSRSSLALFRTGSGSLGVLAVLHPGGNVCHLLVGGSLGTLDDRVRNLGGEQPDGTQRVIVAGNNVIHFGGVAISVHHRNHGNAQLARFLYRDLLLVGVLSLIHI